MLSKLLQESLNELDNIYLKTQEKSWTCDAECGVDRKKIKDFISQRDQKILGAIEKWASQEYGYAADQLKNEKDEEMIEYLTGKRNLAYDFLFFLNEK